MHADELTGPAGYSSAWVVVAVVLPLLVVAYYVGVTVWTGGSVVRLPEWWRLRRDRRRHLARLARIEDGVRRGATAPREAHREVGAVVRSYVSTTGPVDVRAMPLDELRVHAGDVAEVVGATYPPAFRPDDREPAAEQLAEVLRSARTLIRSRP